MAVDKPFVSFGPVLKGTGYHYIFSKGRESAAAKAKRKNTAAVTIYFFVKYLKLMGVDAAKIHPIFKQSETIVAELVKKMKNSKPKKAVARTEESTIKKDEGRHCHIVKGMGSIGRGGTTICDD